MNTLFVWLFGLLDFWASGGNSVMIETNSLFVWLFGCLGTGFGGNFGSDLSRGDGLLNMRKSRQAVFESVNCAVHVPGIQSHSHSHYQ